MKKYLIPLALMLACNEVISLIALSIIACEFLADIMKEAKE